MTTAARMMRFLVFICTSWTNSEFGIRNSEWPTTRPSVEIPSRAGGWNSDFRIHNSEFSCSVPSSAPHEYAGEDRGARHTHQDQEREIAHLLLGQEEADLLDITWRDPHQILARRQPVEGVGRKDRVGRGAALR